mmetsp:Transcript_9995/g.32392  ORF Transcript_9995/g.32392 Transcript_9995/m.32392 type:complete len:326 (+) Transcript_9995:269-1246(+)
MLHMQPTTPLGHVPSRFHLSLSCKGGRVVKERGRVRSPPPKQSPTPTTDTMRLEPQLLNQCAYVYCELEGLLGALGPLEDLLRPVHAHEAVDLAPVHSLVLRRVPQLVVGLPLLELLERVEVLALVRRVDLERLNGPRAGPLDLVVIGVVEAPVVAQLPPHDQLLQEPLRALGLALAPLGVRSGQRGALRRELPGGEIGGEVRHRLRLARVVALPVIHLESGGGEEAAVGLERERRRGLPGAAPRHLGHLLPGLGALREQGLPIGGRGRRARPVGLELLGRRELHEVLLELVRDLLADGARGVLELGARLPAGDDVVGVHLVHGA